MRTVLLALPLLLLAGAARAALDCAPAARQVRVLSLHRASETGRKAQLDAAYAALKCEKPAAEAARHCEALAQESERLRGELEKRSAELERARREEASCCAERKIPTSCEELSRRESTITKALPAWLLPAAAYPEAGGPYKPLLEALARGRAAAAELGCAGASR